jgi:hypothetical protein
MPQPAVEAASDVSFYTMVHDLIEADKRFASHGRLASDQRAANRRSFSCQQLLAPFDGVRLPNQSEFRQVACQDLSAGGFSFVQPQRAEFEELIVALGKVPFQFFTARVQNQTRIRLKGHTAYRVGCRFTGRIVPD